MTLVSLPSPIVYPGIVGQNNSGPNVDAIGTLTSVGHYVAYVFCAKEAMTVSHVGFRAGTSAGSPTIEIRIETLDASALPSGTLWGTNTNATTGTVSSNTWVLQALTASASINAGDIFCVKLALASGTSQAISRLNAMGTSVAQASQLPYYVLNTGSPSRGALDRIAGALALGSSSTTFYNLPGAFPISSTGGSGWSSTNAEKRGLKFTPPMNCRAIGLRWLNNSGAGSYNAVLFSDAGSELSSSSTFFDGKYHLVNNSFQVCYFDNPVTLTAGTAYRVAVEPTTATSVSMLTLVLPAAMYRQATGAGTNSLYTTFTTAGSWVDSATDQLPLMDVIIDQVDNGAGAGGGGSQRVISG